jgi:hypothetical protein
MAALDEPHAPPPRFFTAADASRLTGLSYGFIRELAKTGEAPVAAVVGQCAPLFDDAGIEWLNRRRGGKKAAASHV